MISADCWYTVFVVVDEVTPAEVVTVRDTVNAAGDATEGIVRIGFCAVADGENDAPDAEQDHDHWLTTEPTTVLWSNSLICCVYIVALVAPWTGPMFSGFMTNAATGELVTDTVCVTGELLPAAFVAVSETVYVPAAEKVCVGFWLVLVFPSPKFHDHEVGVFVEVSVKLTDNGAFPEEGE